jgi:Leucine-rich repeat (LRR) protein/energy-coupling factor transporter ATP-binding protein EcfA2
MKLLGPALIRAILTVVFRDEVTGSDMAETLTDSLNIPRLVEQLGGDYAQARTANRFFEDIGDKAAASIGRIFEVEGEAIAEAAQAEAARAAATTLQAHGLRLLLEHHMDGQKWRQALRAYPPPADLHSEHHELYRRVLDECGRTVFAIAHELPHFTRETMGRLLTHTDQLKQDVAQVLDDLDQVYAASYGVRQDEAARSFERDYRDQLAYKLDRLKLFGMPTHVGRYDQPLSVAYVTLKVRPASLTDEAERAETDLPFRRPDRAEEAVVSPTALAQGRRWLVVGRAGSGKTTLLKWVAVQAARQNFGDEHEVLADWQTRVPFFIRLRDFAQTPLPAWEELPVQQAAVPELAGSRPDRWTMTQLKAGRGLILVDGLDEVSQEKREAVLAWVEQLLALAPESVVILSTRPDTLSQAALPPRLQRANFRMLAVQDMDDPTIAQFVDHWHHALGDERSLLPEIEKESLPALAAGLKRGLATQPAVRQLMRNPLLCAMVCALNQARNGRLTEGLAQLDRISLYDDCLTVLLERRDRDRGVDITDYPLHLNEREKKRRLATLAYWLMANGLSSAGQTEAAAQLGSDGETLLRWLVERSGLLQLVGVDQVEFVHRTFQEYLAAQDIVYRNNIRAVCGRAPAADWQETIRLTAGVCDNLEMQQRLLQQLQANVENVAEKEEKETLHRLAIEGYCLMVGEDGAVKELAAAHARAMMTDENELPLSEAILTDAGLDFLPLLTELQRLDLSNTAVTDVGLGHLAGLENLQILWLNNTAVTDAGLGYLARLENLQTLWLDNTAVTDAGLGHLAGLENLQMLWLDNTAVTDTGISHLAKLENLQDLSLINTAVTDAGLGHLAGLKNLRSLWLINTAVTDTGISHLAKLENLQDLSLNNAAVTDTGLGHLAGLKNLRWLQLNNTVITNAGLDHLAGLENLQGLRLENTAVTDLSPLQAQIERGLDVFT